MSTDPLEAIRADAPAIAAIVDARLREQFRLEDIQVFDERHSFTDAEWSVMSRRVAEYRVASRLRNELDAAYWRMVEDPVPCGPVPAWDAQGAPTAPVSIDRSTGARIARCPTCGSFGGHSQFLMCILAVPSRLELHGARGHRVSPWYRSGGSGR